MTREDVIRMAREAGCEIRNGHIYHQFSLDQMLAHFAQAAYAAGAGAEREKCEKVCGAVSNLVGAIESVGIPNVGARKVLNKACEDALKCVDDIRARGEK